MIENIDNSTINGGCYCGAVRFQIASGTQPFLAGYCHCKDCRQAHAAPVYQYVYVDRQYFEITQGGSLLNWYTRSESARDTFRRYFCTTCGSKVYNDLLTMRNEVERQLCGTFPSLFDDQELATSDIWRPQKHVHCAESMMELSLFQDGLPRY